MTGLNYEALFWRANKTITFCNILLYFYDLTSLYLDIYVIYVLLYPLIKQVKSRGSSQGIAAISSIIALQSYKEHKRSGTGTTVNLSIFIFLHKANFPFGGNEDLWRMKKGGQGKREERRKQNVEYRTVPKWNYTKFTRVAQQKNECLKWHEK